MTRLIDADALKNSIDEHVYLVHHGFNETEYGCTQYGIHQIIDEAPTIDAEPVRHGKWINANEGRWNTCEVLKCSECGELDNRMYKTDKYCPHCWCRMDEE